MTPTDSNNDMIRHIRFDRDEVAAHDSDVVVVNREHKSSLDRGVDQPHEVLFALLMDISVLLRNRESYIRTLSTVVLNLKPCLAAPA